MLTKFIFILYCNVIIFHCVLGFPKRITLGGLFQKDDPSHEAFLLSVNAVNKMRHSTEDLANVFFIPDSYELSNDLFELSKQACYLFQTGVPAIFGPSEKVLAEHVESMCESADMPNIVTRWDFGSDRMKSLNLYPRGEELSRLLLQMVTDFQWKTFTILYDSSDSLVRVNQLLKRWDPKGYTVTVLHLGHGPDYRKTLSKVKTSREENIVIDCSYDILAEVLKQSQQVGILSDRHRVIVTNLDLHTLDLEPYQYSGVNFTGMRLVDVENPEALRIFNDFSYDMGLDSLSKLRVEPALTYDAVQLFARAFKQFQDAVKGNIKSLDCNGADNWELGASLSNILRSTEMRGLTGMVKFHTNGFRSDFEIDIIQLTNKGLTKIGVYNSTVGINWHKKEPSKKTDLTNKTFKVLIALNPPYNMLKESAATRTGNDRYEGFAIDIIHELSKIEHFNYTFIQTDPDYGSLIDKRWTGMLGKIIDGEADLAITDLTITAERENAVDFTMPFMNLGISILYRKPTKAAPSLFSFLSPFSTEVWLYLMGAYIFASLCLFVLGRICPAEWNNPYPCIEEPDELQNQFTLKNSLWFSLGAIMQQGSEIAPIGVSTRMLASAWWFFCLIIVASYTANLAAFLVVETTVKPIKSAEDLADLNGAIKYGAKRGGSTINFFKESNYSTYTKMYEYMQANAKDVLTETDEDGRDKVLDPNQNYAFLMESAKIQYIQQRKCNLSQIGGLLDAKGYGIAMRKNSTYRRSFNEAVLQLQETGVLSQLQRKWWEEKRGGGACMQNRGVSPAADHLTLDHVGGVFLVLGIGVGFAIFFAFWEFVWDLGRTTHKQKLSFKNEFVEEMRFVLKCKGTVKPMRSRKTSTETTVLSERSSPPYGFISTVLTSPENE